MISCETFQALSNKLPHECMACREKRDKNLAEKMKTMPPEILRRIEALAIALTLKDMDDPESVAGGAKP